MTIEEFRQLRTGDNFIFRGRVFTFQFDDLFFEKHAYHNKDSICFRDGYCTYNYDYTYGLINLLEFIKDIQGIKANVH